MDRGRYALMSGVCCLSDTISQITTFGTWKRVDSTIHPSRRYLTTRPTLPCASTAAVPNAWEHTVFYPRRLWKYASSGILISIIIIRP